MTDTEGAGPLNLLAQRIHEIAVAHGFWEGGRNFGEMLMLATSELSEALEEHRAGNPDVYYKYSANPSPFWMDPCEYTNVDGQWFCSGEPVSLEEMVDRGLLSRKPEGVSVELVDCLIRLLDTLGARGVDIDAIVAEKMAYNDRRPHMHGKAY